MPNKMLDVWEEAACKEVKQQAFIDASLRPREFRGTWGAKRDPKMDKQGRWKQEVTYLNIKKEEIQRSAPSESEVEEGGD